jgi:1-acyl-sn-glycerol-3-phosphate acyltransferase
MKAKKTKRIAKKRDRKTDRIVHRNIKTSKGFNKFLQFSIGNWLEKNFNMHAENLDMFDKLEPPYLVMANHNCVFDPFMIADFVPEPISYVVSDAAFRKKLMGWALGLVGSIPKTKAISDLGTIKNIMAIREKGGVVGIFPEGQSPWDGHSLPLVYATAKLVRFLKIPVVIAHKQGAYFSMPRWAKSKRKGEVVISFELGFTKEELKTSSVDDIYKKMTKFFDHDEYELQKRDMVRFTGKDRAEYLEIALFVCPECRKIGVMESKGDNFSCKACGYSVYYNEYCFFERENGELYHETVRDWNLWQIEYLSGYLSQRGRENKNDFILRDDKIDVHTGYKTNPLEFEGSGRLSLYSDRVEFESEASDQNFVFPVREIEGANVHEDEKLEFYHDDTLYRIDSKNKRLSMYKWFLCISDLQNPVVTPL